MQKLNEWGTHYYVCSFAGDIKWTAKFTPKFYLSEKHFFLREMCFVEKIICILVAECTLIELLCKDSIPMWSSSCDQMWLVMFTVFEIG